MDISLETLIRNSLDMHLTGFAFKNHKDSIMAYGKICGHDDGYMCECRINELIKRIKNHIDNEKDH